MPWSADEHRSWILDRINEDDTVLDVGAGAGIWADLLKDKVKFIDAVEIFEPYLDRFDLRNKYRDIYLGDFKELAIPYRMYTVIILGDVLEHFEMEDAMQVWEKARRIVGPRGVVLLSSPIIDYPQGEEEGNIHEAHLSQFDMDSLSKLSGVFGWKEGQIIGSVVAEGSDTPVADDLSVLITTIPVREERLKRAVDSVVAQSLLPAELIVQLDEKKTGAAANRDAGIDRVKTKYVALLDDDDFFHPDHLETLYQAALDTDADIVYSWFEMDGGTDPFPENFGKPWDPKNPCQTTVTVLAKVDTIKKAGGYSNKFNMSFEELGKFAQGNTAGEDFRMVFNANKQGAKIVHVPKKTWSYSHWISADGKLGNTSGLPDRW
jgi:SAM-dependent methyltransferase